MLPVYWCVRSKPARPIHATGRNRLPVLAEMLFP